MPPKSIRLAARSRPTTNDALTGVGPSKHLLPLVLRQPNPSGDHHGDAKDDVPPRVRHERNDEESCRERGQITQPQANDLTFCQRLWHRDRLPAMASPRSSDGAANAHSPAHIIGGPDRQLWAGVALRCTRLTAKATRATAMARRSEGAKEAAGAGP
jgi:hypothetical protein